MKTCVTSVGLMVVVMGLASVAMGNLFSEDFSNPTTAAARFDSTESLGWVSPIPVAYQNDKVKLYDYQGGKVTLRTNTANNFTDSGLPVVTYSVEEDMGSSGARIAFLYARLGTAGFSDGYYMYHYFDGGYGALAFGRINGGSDTNLFSSGNQVLLQNDAATTMSIQLTNTVGAVDWEIHYGAFSASGSDIGVNRITSGVGTGLAFQNNGSSDWLSSEFDNLNVVPEPGILTFLGFGLIGLLRRRG